MTTRSLRPTNFQKRCFCLTDWRLNSTHRITENKKPQFDNLLCVIGGTLSCHYDNLQCHQWRQIVKLTTFCFQMIGRLFLATFWIIHIYFLCSVNPLAGPSSKLGHQRFRKLGCPSGTTSNKISLKINTFSTKQMCLDTLSTKYRRFCLGRCDIHYIPWNMHTAWLRFVLLWWYYDQFTAYILMARFIVRFNSLATGVQMNFSDWWLRYLRQCRPITMPPYGVTRPQCVDQLMLISMYA